MPSEITLSLRLGKTDPQPAPREVMEALTEVQVRAGGAGRGGFDLTFALSRRSAIATRLLPTGYFDPPTRVVISVTVRGSRTVLMDGVIAQYEVVPSDEAGRSVLSVKGEDLTRMLDLIDLSGFPYPGLPAEARVAIMIAKYAPIYQIVPLIVPTVLFEVPNPLISVPPQRGTDYTYITGLAARVGYMFRFYPGPEPGMSVAYWGPKVTLPLPFLPKPQPLAIDWDGRSNVESLAFSFDGFKKTQWVVLIQEPTTKLPIPIPVPDVTPLSPPLGAKQPMPLQIRPLVGLAKYNPLQAAAIALARAAQTADVVGAHGSLDVLRYGMVLPLFTTVPVRGAGLTFDGDYFIDSVTHTIKPGSYKQAFTLTRNALLPGNDPLGYLASPVQELAGFAEAGAAQVASSAPASAAVAAAAMPGAPGALPGLGRCRPGGSGSQWRGGGAAHLALNPAATVRRPDPHQPPAAANTTTNAATPWSTDDEEDERAAPQGRNQRLRRAGRAGSRSRGPQAVLREVPGLGGRQCRPPAAGAAAGAGPRRDRSIPTTWAMPCVPMAGPLMGTYFVPPAIGAGVWVEYEQGDPEHPIWVGCFWGPGQLPALAQASATVAPGVPMISLETLASGVSICDTPLPPGGNVNLHVGAASFITVGVDGITIVAPSVKITTASFTVNGAALSVV